MPDGRIYITISNQLNGATAQQTTSAVEQQAEATQTTSGSDKKSSKNSRKWYQTSAALRTFRLVKDQTMTWANFAVSNIGNFTGDYLMQQNANEFLSVANTVVNIGFAAYTGARFGGVAGGIAGAVVATLNAAASIAQQEIKGGLENRYTNRNIAILRELSGLNSLVDGSRGTQN